MFGSHATSTPEPTDVESAAPGSSKTRLAVIGVVLAMVVACGWFVVSLLGDDGSAAAACTPADMTTVTMTVAPAMADLVDEAVDAMGESAQCIELEVTTATVAEVSAAQEEVDEGDENVLPDLWVPDSPAWQTVLGDAGLTGKAIVPALATTPVGLASGSTIRVPRTWLEALSSPRLVKNDPLENGASALAMVAPFSEAAEGVGDITTAQRSIVPVAQRFGAKVAAGRLRPVTIDTIPGGSKRLIPVTERDFLIAKRGNEALTWLEPATGVAVLDFPLVQPDAGAGGIGVGSGSLDVAGRTGERLAKWFTTEEGLAAIAGDQLRAPDGGPLPDDESVTTSKQLPSAEANQVRATMDSWFNLTVPSSILVVFEASDAMNDSVGGSTRLDIGIGGALTALGALPDHARIGLWAFSTNQGGPGQDWRELAPLRRLDAPIGKGETQVDLLRQQVDVVPGLAGGGTGLYDTVLAAYRLAAREYNPAYSNSVSVLTGGVNDDPGSMTLAQLLSELETLHDPERPVRIIPVGIGAGADMSALGQIADATGGQAFEADSPESMITVLASGLLSR
ncbi:MAG: hypothetical protein ABIR39_06935 [Nocardioides sp.]|uniref:hypothetical protein n=1 Tax=Nocardioides sp. TaxID=35761 RepID=UPI003266A049